MNTQKTSPNRDTVRKPEAQPRASKPLINPNAKAEDEIRKLHEERERLANDPTPNDNDVRSAIP